MTPRHLLWSGGLLLSLALAFVMSAPACRPDPGVSGRLSVPTIKPWEYSLDSMYALRHPDRYAWDLFRMVNWPADTLRQMPDTTRFIGDTGLVVWQTWKTGPEVYLADGTRPKGWLEKTFGFRSEENFNQFSIKARLPDISDDPTFGLEEVVMNEETFTYVLENELYNLNGQLARYLRGDTINFPRGAIELKVKWRQIRDTPYEKARYHWQYVTVYDNGKTSRELYGLVSIHITSKVLQQWFWATFEHIDSRSQQHPGDDGWLLASRDRFACTEPPYDCEQAPQNIGLEGTKWEYYVLRGTQTAFTDDRGAATLLANSNVERGFQLSSSCMTCHSLASFGPILPDSSMARVDFLPEAPLRHTGFGGKGYVGIPDTALFRLKDGQRMLQTDFAWSLSEANWYSPGAPKPLVKR
ncbi:MAG: hypothetical protein SF053_19105 [Bacteroidia bacterium]|nr:hypothetical protein [Bacteroidia bacterium]